MTEHYEGEFRIVGKVIQIFTNNDWVNCEYTSDYDKGRADMLSEVIKWLNIDYQTDPNLSRETIQRGGFKTISIALEKAMRPQQQEEC